MHRFEDELIRNPFKCGIKAKIREFKRYVVISLFINSFFYNFSIGATLKIFHKLVYMEKLSLWI